MKVTVEDVNDTRKKVHITVDAVEIANEEKDLLKQFSRHAKLPGFRPGKAPANLIRSKFKNELKAELGRKLVGNAYEQGVSESGLDVYAVVEMDGGDIEPGAPGAELSFTIDIRPTVNLSDYKGVPVSVPQIAVTDEEFQRRRDSLLDDRAEYNVVQKAAEAGDYVNVSYEGKIGDERIADLLKEHLTLGTLTNTWVQVGNESEKEVPAVAQGLLGMAAGDKKEVVETFPEDHVVEALQGKTATYAMEVHQVREKVLPELNEEFWQSFGVETADEWEEQIRDDIRRQKERKISELKRQQLLDQLMAQVEFPVPQSALESERDLILSERVDNALRAGVPEAELEESKDSLVEEAAAAAEKRVKTQIILGHIAKKEAITVENEEIQGAILNRALHTRTPVDEIVKQLQKNRDQLQELQQAVLYQKTLDFLVDAANVVELEPANT